MSWSAKVIRTVPTGDLFESSVFFVNDQDATQNYQQSFIYDGTQAALEKMVQSRLAKAAPPSSGATVNLTPPAPPAPPAPPSKSAADVARDAWVGNASLWHAMKWKVDAGLVAPSDKSWTDLDAWLKANYLPEYANLS